MAVLKVTFILVLISKAINITKKLYNNANNTKGLQYCYVKARNKKPF